MPLFHTGSGPSALPFGSIEIILRWPIESTCPCFELDLHPYPSVFVSISIAASLTCRSVEINVFSRQASNRNKLRMKLLWKPAFQPFESAS